MEAMYCFSPGIRGQFRIFAVGVVLAVTGCATVGPAPVPEKGREALVMERAQARWEALVNDRIAEAYGFYSPASRSVMTLQDFTRSIKSGFWKSARVDRVECQAEESCEAQVTIEYLFQGRRVSSPLRETWIRTDGKWWYVKKA